VLRVLRVLRVNQFSSSMFVERTESSLDR